MPDKEHFHHQMLKLNLSKRKTVLIIYFIDILFFTLPAFGFGRDFLLLWKFL